LILIIGFFSGIQTSLASEEILVFILAGQSNMRGRGEVHELLCTAPRLIKVPENVEFHSTGTKRSLFGERNLRWTFGPEVIFAHEISEAWPEQKICVVKYTVSGSDLASWGKTHYDTLMGHVQAATKGKQVEYAGLLWMQGETDAESIEKSEQYFENLKALIQRTRRDLQSGHCPFLIGSLSASHRPGCEIVREAQRKVTEIIAGTYLVSTEGLTTLEDNIHYDSKGQIELGRRFAKALLALEEH
jgi:hypothetical protein